MILKTEILFRVAQTSVIFAKLKSHYEEKFKFNRSMK